MTVTRAEPDTAAQGAVRNKQVLLKVCASSTD